MSKCNSNDSGMGCIVLIFLIWFFFCGGCTALKHWTDKQNEPAAEVRK